MRLTRILKITEKEFYDFLETSLLSNIRQCTGRELSIKDIKKGFKYSKHEEDVLTRIDVSILDYERGFIYQSITKSLADTITISFETEVVKDGLKIIFNQSLENFESKKQNKFLRMFSEAVYLGRMTDTLYDIEKKIMNNRSESVEVAHI